MLVDTHTHLDAYGEQIPQVLAAARAAGVGHIVVCGMTLRSSERALEVARAHPEMTSAGAGVHPWRVQDPPSSDAYAAFRQLIEANRQYVRSIGEIGLDYSEAYVDRKEAQCEAFRGFVRLARELELPMTIHVRGAHADAARILAQERSSSLRAGIHGFEGSEEDARRYLDLGLLIGIGRNALSASEALQLVFRALPLDRMLVETDASFHADRDFNWAPAMVRDVATRLAEIKGVSLEEVERLTTRNFDSLHQ